MAFRGSSEPDGSFTESLYLLRLLSHEEIHCLGCARAVRLNEREQAKREGKGKMPPEPVSGEDRKYYCGFVSAKAETLQISGTKYEVTLELDPEDGVEGHVSIALRPKGVTKVTAADRTEAGRLLARKFGEPVSKVCDIDKEDRFHPVNARGINVLRMS